MEIKSEFIEKIPPEVNLNVKFEKGEYFVLKPEDKTVPMVFDVKGNMRLLKQDMYYSAKQSNYERFSKMLNEFRKFVIYDFIGIKSVPIVVDSKGKLKEVI
ncbi:MAG: hypothetical protein DRJ35_08345 [Thermoprotei archaeon]|nr:MAG: hypothetical protein DRJ35_08345 [Thermoprotei archaeon]